MAEGVAVAVAEKQFNGRIVLSACQCTAYCADRVEQMSCLMHSCTQVVRSRLVSLQTPSSKPSSDPYCPNRMTLIDTPGQDIFYRMRNYGAAVADIGVLVVSAKGGVCDQTEESIGILEQLQVRGCMVGHDTT